MMPDWLFDRMIASAHLPAMAVGEDVCDYEALLDRVRVWDRRLTEAGVSGRVVSLEAEYGVEAVAAFLAAASAGNIVVPISRASHAHAAEFIDVAQVEVRLRPEHDQDAIIPTGQRADHPFYAALRRSAAPGLVLFSSGSTGKHKAAVHDLGPLLQKFAVPRQSYRTLVFLQLDHIGGVNTLFYTLANAGTVVVPEARTPRAVAASIARHRVNLLPTSPTFLNLLLLSEEHLRHDLSSLSLITYGTEPMPAITLERTHAAFPDVRLLQTYGLSELGILRSQSRESNSLWMRVGGEGYETKIVDGRLFIRAASAMLGYLNAPSPFDADGFFDTGDLAEVDGDWLRIVGRKSEVINVGGNKVFPLEVENALLALDNVEDVAVHGAPNPFTGQIVVATVKLRQAEDVALFKARMRLFCGGTLAAHKIPAQVRFVDSVHSERFKKVRPNGRAGEAVNG
jgi:long-chain acyl-CoA synthetase